MSAVKNKPGRNGRGLGQQLNTHAPPAVCSGKPSRLSAKLTPLFEARIPASPAPTGATDDAEELIQYIIEKTRITKREKEWIPMRGKKPGRRTPLFEFVLAMKSAPEFREVPWAIREQTVERWCGASGKFFKQSVGEVKDDFFDLWENTEDQPHEPFWLTVFRARRSDPPPEVRNASPRVQIVAAVARQAQRSRPGTPFRLGTHQLAAELGMKNHVGVAFCVFALTI